MKNGELAGEGLSFHFKALMRLLWPEEDQHRWFHLIVDEWCRNTMTCVMGCKDSSKTRTMATIALADYYCFPDDTLGIISSTTGTGSELRIWGDIKTMHVRARQRCDFLPGKPIDSLHAITTDDLKETDTRDLRRGLICIAGNKAGDWPGMKQRRRRLYADECQYMKAAFVQGLANMNSGDFKGMFCGNPIGEGDPLDKLCEPKNGWQSLPEPEKTTVWDTRDVGGRCINLIGTDSPNFDQPQEPEAKYWYLINQKSIDRVVARFNKHSFQYYSQCKGIRLAGMDNKKVITRDLCLQFHALEPVYWRNETRTKVYAVDAAYGNIGGDRCVGGWIEFGYDVTDKLILSVGLPTIIPVRPAKMANRIPEDQIADFVRGECERERIEPHHVFYDATGRGSLGTAFARIWSAQVNPVEFGGNPTERPVPENNIRDHKTGYMRPMKASEKFSKFVTELWWSVRYIIESGQMRNLPEDVMIEGARRIWRPARGDKTELETKAEMKERTDESPDLFDWLATACEGARRLGFQIDKMIAIDQPKFNDAWKKDLRKRSLQLRERMQLDYKC